MRKRNKNLSIRLTESEYRSVKIMQEESEMNMRDFRYILYNLQR